VEAKGTLPDLLERSAVMSRLWSGEEERSPPSTFPLDGTPRAKLRHQRDA
jgi:hypothetical protein